MEMEKTEGGKIRFAVCVSNMDYPGSLEVGKLYRVIADDQANAHGYFRVVDESGEDYAYAKDRFFPSEVPETLEHALSKVV
ncbi:MAG: hypothetical protein LGR52_07205 [Candidatus Thiosymbion ectosymbiont of Robbea hypermnestra]|nr:hypothetical protein [Candidatus Thiosymbion ectosymbiont of Robbea hypermnestra]